MGLAFQAGSANAGGFLLCARFVSHMTGFGTQVGVSLSRFDYSHALEMVSAPLVFMCGAMFSGVLIDRRMLCNQRPRFILAMAIVAAIFTGVAIGGIMGLFGEFGLSSSIERESVLLFSLSFACGLQNACFSSLTRGQIRTTHLTGILTDVGTTFVKLPLMDREDRDAKLLRRVNYIRIMTFFSFSIGSMASAIWFTWLGFWAFVILSSWAWLLTLAVWDRDRLIRRLKEAT